METTNYYRFIVMFTMNDSDRNSFIETVKLNSSLGYEQLVDQSTFVVQGDCISIVTEQLKKCLPNEKTNDEYFVKLYFSASLANDDTHRDYICEKQIW